MNSINVADAVKNREPRPDKYFLCYGFGNFDKANLKEFHVTTIYFGELSPSELKHVIKITKNHAEEGDLAYMSFYSKSFFKEALFGKDENIRVLLPDEDHHDIKILVNMTNDLIDKVKAFRKHNDYPFRPHLTTHLHSFHGTLSTLFLCKNNYEVVESWKMNQ